MVPIVSLLSISTVLSWWWYVCKMLPAHESRTDTVPVYDFILDLFPVIDTSIPVNFIAYAAYVRFFAAVLIEQQVNMQLTLLLFLFFPWVRSLCLSLLPLDTPDGFAPLYDPLQRFILKNNSIGTLDKDLFFSGHVSILLMFGYSSNISFFFWAAFVTAVLMLFSRVHYTIDLLMAPFVIHGLSDAAHYLIEKGIFLL